MSNQSETCKRKKKPEKVKDINAKIPRMNEDTESQMCAEENTQNFSYFEQELNISL